MKFLALILESPPKKFTSEESENEMKKITKPQATNENFESGKAILIKRLKEFKFKSFEAFQYMSGIVLRDAELINIPKGIQLITITKYTLIEFEPLNTVIKCPVNELRIAFNKPFSDKRYCQEKTLTDSLAKNGRVNIIKKVNMNNLEV